MIILSSTFSFSQSISPSAHVASRTMAVVAVVVKGRHGEIIEGTNANHEGQNLYDVIRTSFNKGLNPLECLLHTISLRANFFSKNVVV
jgi:hypothetical protein